MRNILLIEPPYRNKYPPIGLMKISSYHKSLGDNVEFFKGNVSDYGQIKLIKSLVPYFLHNGNNISKVEGLIRDFITKGYSSSLELLYNLLVHNTDTTGLVIKKLKLYRMAKIQNRIHELVQWDRIYVTSLFTFYWDITVKTIKDAKPYVMDINDLKIGGIMASLIPREIEEETNIKPIEGLLDSSRILDDNDIIIDDLPPDYLILDQIDYDYPAKNSYITFMTKGCTRTCSFCAVPKIEPTFREQIPTKSKLEYIQKRFGEKVHLLLMDNNVLASPKLSDIIDEIIDMGFTKDSKCSTENIYEVYIQNLKEGFDEESYTLSIHKYLKEFLGRLDNHPEVKDEFYHILYEHSLLNPYTITKDGILESYEKLSPLIDKFRPKGRKKRYVDFNQGTDARYVTDELMEKLSNLPIKPLRIAFDYLVMKKQYIKAVELASKYGIKELSNYLLYNFNDKPDQLWERMNININLSKRLGINIFSFPMKYIPLYGEESKHRDYIGKYWNRKFIRSIQIILNVTKGIVASGETFFHKAFGSNPNEFMAILHMPEQYIMYRKIFEESGLIKLWKDQFESLSVDELKVVLPQIHNIDYHLNQSGSNKLDDLLSHYTIRYSDEVLKSKKSVKSVRNKYKEMIEKDVFLDMTLTYDYDNNFLNNLGKELTYNLTT
jgi:hypothetical protein|tara:strand:- start:129 stop:2117 length:1989 start_codon:yes stop_codon:yes gene_type:complete